MYERRFERSFEGSFEGKLPQQDEATLRDTTHEPSAGLNPTISHHTACKKGDYTICTMKPRKKC